MKMEPVHPEDLQQLLLFAFAAGCDVTHPMNMSAQDKERWADFRPAPRSTFQRVEHAVAHSVVTDEMVERAARAVEARRMQTQYGWSDELFETWWSKDPEFITRKRVWGWFEGTLKERCLWEARIALEAALS